MVSVDPSGLAAAAQRITSALSELTATNPEHPALAADPASVGAATRLTTAGTALAGVLAQQAAGLAATAEQLVNVATGFTVKDAANAAKLASLDTGSDGPTVSGWAPPSPPIPPDARPPLPVPPGAPGEVISHAVHSGDPAGGETFIAGWRQVAGSARDASAAVRLVADSLPDSWDSPVATDVVRKHLLRYADAFDSSGDRADTVAEQANRHSQEVTQARNDIPSPSDFDAMNRRLQTIAQANAESGGMYAVPLANAVEQKHQMETQAAQGFGGYFTSTEATTAGEVDLDGDGVVSPEEAAAAAEAGIGLDEQGGALGEGEAGSSDMAGELSSMLPSMIPTVLGAAGGLLGGAVSSLMKGPETLMQAGSQAMGAATQGLSGLMQPELDDIGSEDLGLGEDGLGGMGGFGGGGAGGTSPAAGGAPSVPPVMPSTGPNPTPPTLPSGGQLPPPVTPGMGHGGAMPMGGMPMGGMPMGGGQGNNADDSTGRPKQVVGKDRPNTESVTGKVAADRIAMSATAPERSTDGPNTNDDPPAQQASNAPVIRRITTVGPKDGS